jgi:MFS family permease
VAVPNTLSRARTAWRQISRPARRLLAARFWRSLAQGMLVVDLALYLDTLGWSGTRIGIVLGAAGATGAALNLAVGVTSDRVGRKPFLLAYEVLTCACALVMMTHTSAPWLFPAIVLAGFGRGGNGAAGPFSPAEQAWLAESVAVSRRGFVYSINTAFGFVGMAIGCAAAGLAPLLAPSLGTGGSYRALFTLVLLGNAVNLVLLSTTAERKRDRVPEQIEPAAATGKRADEDSFLRRLAALNALNGMAIGITGPLIAYWFAMRFHVGPGRIGPVLAATFLATAFSAVVMARLSNRLGLVRPVVWGRTVGVGLLVLLPLMPAYTLAGLAYLLRSAVNRGTIGVRQALVVSVVRDERRGFASSMNALSAQIPMSVGPVIAGAMIGARLFVVPFYVAAALQGLYVLLYGRVFPSYERAITDNGD